MKRTIYIAIFALLVLTSAALAGSRVENVGLSYQKGYTVASIDVDGPVVRFSHQTEEAKDGKPFRIIVDILTATHHLGQKSFRQLPTCPITAIRSSQYAVDPEQVVRVVFDMNSETVYRIDSDDKAVRVFIPDDKGQAFASWSSAEYVAAQARKNRPQLAQKPTESNEPQSTAKSPTKTAKERNKAFGEDRLASLAGDKPTRPEPASSGNEKPEKAESRSDNAVQKPSGSVEQKAEQKPSAPAQPRIDKARRPAEPIKEPQGEFAVEHLSHPTGTQRMASYPGEWIEAPKEAVQQAMRRPEHKVKAASPSTARLAQADPEPTKQTAPARKEKTSQKPAKAKPGVSKEMSGPPAPAKTAARSDDKKSDPVQPKKQPVTARKNAPEKTDNDGQSLAANKDSKSSPTSRFRREPAMSKKMRGTIVAEFPKRLVIKYKTSKYRDPFETLINESRVLSSPTEQRIPNVEGLKLVGVIQSPAGSRALFEDTDGYGYFLKAGDKVQKGYVLRIEAEKVYFQIFEYGWSRTVALTIDEN